MIEIVNLHKRKDALNPWDFNVSESRRKIDPESSIYYELSNPFVMADHSEEERNIVCDLYEDYFNNMIRRGSCRFKVELGSLAHAYKKYGKLNLCCWCHPNRCHAETIKRWLENNAANKQQ